MQLREGEGGERGAGKEVSQSEKGGGSQIEKGVGRDGDLERVPEGIGV
jgi:hypothetical protein